MSRLLFVCKRRPQQRDLLTRPYGRFHHLPRALAALGHDVHVALIGHGGHQPDAASVDDVSITVRDLRHEGLTGVSAELVRTARAFSPHWVIGCSDAWVGCLAAHVAKSTRARLALDAYDNFEAYMAWNLPLHWLWRGAVHRADVVTAAGPQLGALLSRYRSGRRAVDVLPMAADPEFEPHDRLASRSVLGLPQSDPLVGYIGSWSGSRGSNLILDMLREVRAWRPEVRLVLTGRPPRRALDQPGVIGVGHVPDAQMPALVSSLDVACVVTANTPFGRYSYPAKLCEAMACAVPLVASATDAVRWMLGDDSKHLAPVGDVDGHASRVLALLRNPVADYGIQATWDDRARQLDSILASVAG